MPYLDEAARQLGISEKTLRRWLKLMDPPIEPTKDRRNLRFKFIEDSDVERIRQERASVAALTGADATLAHKPNMPPNALRGKSDGLDSLPDRFPIPTAKKRRQQPLSNASVSVSGLPAGWMSKKEAARLHGIPRATIDGWCKAGKVATDPGTYEQGHGHWPIVQPITAQGLAQFYELASPRDDFVRCSACPHQDNP